MLLLAACGGLGCGGPSAKLGAAENAAAQVRGATPDAAGAQLLGFGLGAGPADGKGEGGSPEEASESLVIAVRAIPQGLDPLTDLDPWAARVVEDAVFEGLTRRSDVGAPWAEPALADACVLASVASPRDAYCHIPADRQFHDGSPVTMDDVVYSLEHWLDPRRERLRGRQGLSALRRVEVVDGPPETHAAIGTALAADPGRWIRISSETPDPLLLERIARMSIVPREAHRGHATRFARAPVGSGPMRVAEYETDRVVLEAVQPEAGHVKRIVLLAVRDGASALTGLRRGEIHVVASVSPSHIPAELAKPGTATRFTAWLCSPAVYDLVLYNARKGPTAGPRLRTALDTALPRAEIARALGGTPPMSVTAPVDLHAPTPIDLEALEAADAAAHAGMGGLPTPVLDAADVSGQAIAGALLEELGWTMDRGLRRRGTTTLRLVLMWNGDPGVGRTVATAVRDAWRSVGVHVPFATASWSYLMGPLRRGDFELGLGRLAEHSDADLFPYFHRQGDLNVPGVADDELDAALVAYRDAATPAERAAAKTRVHDRLAALRIVSVLRAPTDVLVASRRVDGLRFIDDLPSLRGLELLPPQEWELGTSP